ncbi:hypothetical protein EVAR_8146_1 [Eumeta japonica]|uniref:Uncharacterized protein n=1 Tax=Eumeta variegata TaxID=151549 RepID=A0A4C1TSU2_EUMVA|nr:hypothetical protein EVAR_8146_1 [Eumeta japonica]
MFHLDTPSRSRVTCKALLEWVAACANRGRPETVGADTTAYREALTYGLSGSITAPWEIGVSMRTGPRPLPARPDCTFPCNKPAALAKISGYDDVKMEQFRFRFRSRVISGNPSLNSHFAESKSDEVRQTHVKKVPDYVQRSPTLLLLPRVPVLRYSKAFVTNFIAAEFRALYCSRIIAVDRTQCARAGGRAHAVASHANLNRGLYEVLHRTRGRVFGLFQCELSTVATTSAR